MTPSRYTFRMKREQGGNTRRQTDRRTGRERGRGDRQSENMLQLYYQGLSPKKCLLPMKFIGT